MNLKYMPGFIHLLAAKFRHENKQETHVLFAVVL
jgi:hypothetical protein